MIFLQAVVRILKNNFCTINTVNLSGLIMLLFTCSAFAPISVSIAVKAPFTNHPGYIEGRKKIDLNISHENNEEDL